MEENMEENLNNDVQETLQEEQPDVQIEEQEPVDAATQKIQELEALAAENFDKYQRVFAEFDNFRKRTAREKASMYDNGVRDTIEKLLSVVDNLERAVMVKEGESDDPILKGVTMILKQFIEVLNSMGVEAIEAKGEQFDPNLHAAVAHEENEDYGINEIMEELLKGYKYKDKVIRHSMVKVAN